MTRTGVTRRRLRLPLQGRRRVRDPGRQLGLLWGLVAVLLVALSPWAGRLATLLPECLFKGHTGLPCLGCGAARSALALARLDALGALELNPLATLAWLGLVGGGLLAGVLALAGMPVREPDWRLPSSVRRLLAAILVANWIYLIAAGA